MPPPPLMASARAPVKPSVNSAIASRDAVAHSVTKSWALIQVCWAVLLMMFQAVTGSSMAATMAARVSMATWRMPRQPPMASVIQEKGLGMLLARKSTMEWMPWAAWSNMRPATSVMIRVQRRMSVKEDCQLVPAKRLLKMPETGAESNRKRI